MSQSGSPLRPLHLSRRERGERQPAAGAKGLTWGKGGRRKRSRARGAHIAGAMKRTLFVDGAGRFASEPAPGAARGRLAMRSPWYFWDSALGREPLSPRYSGLSLVARLLLGLSFRAWAIAHRSAGFLILWRAVVGGEAEPWMREGVLGGHARLGVSSTGAA